MKRTKAFYLVAILAVSSLLLSTVNAQTIPEEARRHMARGQAAVEIAKSAEEYGSAINEFQQASRLAPDWPDPYFQLANLQEKTGKLKEAVVSLKEYLRLAPNASDAAKIQEQIYKLEYKAEQVLTVPEIIDVLVSFSNDKHEWEQNGGCASWWGKEGRFEITRDTREGDNVVKLIYGNIYRRNPKEFYASFKVTGPVLGFQSVVNVCDESANKQEGGCDAVYENEITVVSKRIVKLRQKVLQGGSGAGEKGGKQYLCTFKKKSSQDALELDLSIQSKDRVKVESLIAKGADINDRNRYGTAPLESAVSISSKDIVELLITKGADVNAVDKDESTLMHYAVSIGDTDIAELLIASGAAINTKNKYGWTPLYKAVTDSKKEMAELLIAKGADINAKDNDGNTLLQLAVTDSKKEMAELLIAKGADINAKNNNGLTPLHLAVMGNKKEIAELLITKGADINAKDNHGLMPLQFAYNKKEIAELLKKHGARE